jgi:hypothetical protein
MKKTQGIPLMKKIITFAAAAMVMAAAPAFAAGNNATAQADSTATVIAPITISKVATKDLMFGTLIAGYSDSTVSNAGLRTGNTDFELSVGAGARAVGAAQFTVGGDTTRAFTTGAVVDAGNQLTGLTLTNDAPATLTAGAATINVGGKLPAGLVAGSYTGTISVTVTYN